METLSEVQTKHQTAKAIDELVSEMAKTMLEREQSVSLRQVLIDCVNTVAFNDNAVPQVVSDLIEKVVKQDLT